MCSAWVYILRCSDGSYYTGSTTDLSTRIAKHEVGLFGGYTATRRPVTLVWSQEFVDVQEAIIAERRLKGWTRVKKEALIGGDFDLLHELSRSSATKRKEIGRGHPSTPSQKRFGRSG